MASSKAAMSSSSLDESESEVKSKEPEPSPRVAADAALVVSEAEATKKWRVAIEALLQLEKKERQNEDERNGMFLCGKILDMCLASGNWPLTIEMVEVVCKRRSQFRRVVVKTVQRAMEWIGAAENPLHLVNALIGVTEGKIFVEVERARLTRRKAQMAETEGRVADAAEILQELQIETFGSMLKREKCDFLLEQVRLCLAKRDFIRAGIIRNKITQKILKGLKDLETKYWNLSLIYFFHHERQYLELSKAYGALKQLLIDESDTVQALANAAMAVVLAPFGNEQSDLLHKTLLNEAKLLEHLPVFTQLLRLLTTSELIEWPLAPEMHSRLSGFSFTGVAAEDQSYEELLNARIVQHNIRVAHKYYSRITTKRLATFLKVSPDDTERYLSEMVSAGDLYARIDRLDGIIAFRRKETATAIVDDWRADINKLLNLVDQSCHQIHKETMVHSSKRKKKKKSRR